MQEGIAHPPAATGSADTQPSADHASRQALSAAAASWGLVAGLWRREMLRLRRELSRWLGVVLQPLLFWAMIGGGMGDAFRPAGLGAVSYLTYFFPGVLIMVVLFTCIFSMISVIEDRQSGFLQGVLTAPGGRSALAMGKIAGVATMALIQAALFVALAPVAGYALGDIRWGVLLVVLVLASIGLGAVNFAMAWVMDSTHAFHAVMSILLLPLWVLSGAMFPAQGAASLVRGVMVINPMRYAVEGARAALGGVSEVSLGGSLLALTGFAVVAMLLATWACRRRGMIR